MQNIQIKATTDKQKKILELEKKYFEILETFFSGDKFKKDLQNIKKEIQDNYCDLSKETKNHNKIQIALERILRFHIYGRSISNLNIEKPYYSPISCDIAFETKDAIIHIDSKTIDLIENKGDIKFLQFLPNQSSFNGKGMGPFGYKIRDKSFEYNGVPIISRLPTWKASKPILTYFLKLIYSDNGSQFDFQKENNLTFTSLPNGELSELFTGTLIDRAKTYCYSSEDEPIELGQVKLKKGVLHELFNTGNINLPDKNDECILSRIKSKDVIWDHKNQKLWTPVSKKVRNKTFQELKVCIGIDTARISSNDLKARFDHQDNPWDGHKVYTV